MFDSNFKEKPFDHKNKFSIENSLKFIGHLIIENYFFRMSKIRVSKV